MVITGATSGIGRETARRIRARGACVVAAGRREDAALDELGDEIEGTGGAALAVATDVADAAQVDRLIERDDRALRRGRHPRQQRRDRDGRARFEEQSIADFRRVMEVNFWGAVHACKAALPHMRAQASGGLIINISSHHGQARAALRDRHYCASKFATGRVLGGAAHRG